MISDDNLETEKEVFKISNSHFKINRRLTPILEFKI
jgi:hypothetical protein